MPRNCNAYNRLQIAENEIIGGIQLGNPKPRRRSSFSSRQPRIAHDEYTIKTRLEMSENQYDNFIDRDGKKVPIHESYLYDMPVGHPFFEELDLITTDDGNEETSKELASTHKKSVASYYKRNIKSVARFFSFSRNHGLYNAYNPKLNAGAPGNVKEHIRRERKFAEKIKWESVVIDFAEKLDIFYILSEEELEYNHKKAS